MTYIELYKDESCISGRLTIGGSKSESNRLLILKGLFPKNLKIENLSSAKDTKILHKALFGPNNVLYVQNAGTAMRFLTAYCTIQSNKTFTLIGSKRMHERPIGVLVQALRKLGANIDYLGTEGYPPLKIYGNKLIGGNLSVRADTSSQYISALMLIGAFFEKGLSLHLEKKITSKPYISMTIELLRKAGISVFWNNREVFISPATEPLASRKFFVESDWSSASYYYSLAAMSKQVDIQLSIYKKESLQGDQKLYEIYCNYFGVKTSFKENSIFLTKDPSRNLPEYFECDLNQCPDIAQTIAISCTGLKIKCLLTGLETLKIKETDRLQALQNELFKVGVRTYMTENSLEIFNFQNADGKPLIHTYNDHRMAMSFAPLALYRSMIIQNPNVVEKSYPNFWRDIKQLGFSLKRWSEPN
ncbi:MAG: 3-phosphoshikimate 1-carboxyvinyltransferase [Candidatus Walczuchella monophlebidarum]